MVSWRTTVCGALAALAVMLQAADWTSWRSLLLSSGIVGLGYFAHDKDAACPLWVKGQCVKDLAAGLAVKLGGFVLVLCAVFALGGCSVHVVGPAGVGASVDGGDSPPAKVEPVYPPVAKQAVVQP